MFAVEWFYDVMRFEINPWIWFPLLRSGILQKMKEGAENVERKIQAKVESLKNVNEGDKG